MEIEKLYNAFFNDVFVYILRLSGNEHIAEEITSETFFKALRSIDSFRGECEVRVWLCQIAKNCYYSYLKKNSRLTDLDEIGLQSLTDLKSGVEDQIADHDEAMLIQRYLHMLPEPYKEVFMWRVFADVSYKQIGQIFNKSDNWACVTYHRARNMLRERMEESKNEK